MSNPVFKPKPHVLEALFGRRRVVIGVIHSRPLPGSPGYDGQAISRCRRRGGIRRAGSTG